MKIITYQISGDPLEFARVTVAAEIFNRVNSLDDCDKLLQKHFGKTAEAITFGDISKEEFCSLRKDTIILP